MSFIFISDIEGDFELFLRSMSLYGYRVVSKLTKQPVEITIENYKEYIDPMNLSATIELEKRLDSTNKQIVNLGDVSKGPYSKVIAQLFSRYNKKNPDFPILSTNGNRDINQIGAFLDLPRLGELYENELSFIHNNNEIDIDRLLMDSMNPIRHKEQYKDGITHLHHVDPGRQSFLLYLLNDEANIVGAYKAELEKAKKESRTIDPALTAEFSKKIKARLEALEKNDFLKAL